MDGNDDFRPEAAHRASDPSIEEMLRRARDAHLGDSLGTPNQHPPHLTPFFSMTSARVRDGILTLRTAFLAGVLIGALAAYMVIQAGDFIGDALSPAQPAAQSAPTTTVVSPTATPLSTATDTPLPTPTDVPTAPPALTTDEIVALAQDFYDTLSPFAGTYVLMDGPEVQIQSQGDTQLTACIAYHYASVGAPDTVAGSDIRLFTLAPSGDGAWQVMGMYDSGSCRMS